MEYTFEQRKAIKTVDRDLVVTAGAGTGKTLVLVDRILNILEQGLARIDEIVAITYTKKAALEIRERLCKEMRKQKGDKGNISEHLEKLGIAYIGTVHSFCLRLLKENPVEAHIDPDVKVLEEGRANAWLKESVKHAIVDNLEDKPVLQLVSEMGFSKLTNELYESMLKMRNQGLTPSDIHKLVESETEKILGMLINRAYSMYNNKKAQQSFLDYEDILQRTFNLLVRNKKVLNECRRKFKFILIDEYQDLNFVQDKILRLLGEDNNFFVVGDKKQSIYGFRGARVELFEKLRRDLENRGQALNLKDNFRSDGRIVEYVNQKFKGLMKEYEPINAYRPSSSQKNIYFLTLESKGLMDERRRREGEFIARTILKMMTDDSVKIHDRETKEYRKPTFRDFSVLLRRRTHLKHYTKALKNYKIPFYVADAGSLMESTSVKHLLCALNTIEYGDDINLYGTLSHLFKISDNTLAEYVLKGQELILGLKEGAVDVKDSKSLTDAFQLIRKWCKMKERVTIRELAGKIIEETKLLSFAVQRDSPEAESLLKFLDLCMDYDEQGYVLKEFLEELSDLGQEQQEATDASEGEDVVRFITIHSSKGLEFPIVILADSGQRIPSISSEILFEAGNGIALKKDRDKWEMLKETLEQKEIEEATRLLYVALTRARDYLLISGEMQSGKRESFLKWLNQETGEVQINKICELPDVNMADVRLLSPKVIKTEPKKAGILQEPIPVSKNYSVTSLGEYLRCPRKYYLNNIIGIPERLFYKRESTQLGLSPWEKGTIVHELIEKIHRENICKNNAEKLSHTVKQQMTFEDREFIQRCLQNYLESDIYNNNISKTIYSETPFSYYLEKGRYITGIVDQIIFEKDSLTIVDFKTDVSLNSTLLESYIFQVKAYSMAASEVYNVKPKRAIILSLSSGESIEVDTCPPALQEFKTGICRLIDNIDNNVFNEKAQDKANCKYCAYKDILCE